MPEDLGATNTYDMIRVDSASALEITGCQAFIDNSGNNWRYAISKGTNAAVIATGNDFRAVTGFTDNYAGLNHINNTLEEVLIPGSASIVGGTKVTLTDAATVTVNSAAGGLPDLDHLLEPGDGRSVQR
jgi:hypothetical protein